MSSTTEEQKILEGIVAGDEVIITAFYKKNLPYILQNSGNEEDVEDVFQDAMIFIYQRLKTDSLEIHSSIRTYFYGVCKNIWRNKVRKNKKLVITEYLPEDIEIINPTVFKDLECKEQEHIYRKHFLKLSDTCREVLCLVFQGMNMKEIAKVTGYSDAYTRKKKFECKRHLIEMIEKDPAYPELQSNPEKE
ncbi:RNA polymerase sigma factor [Aquimarina muelleri]|uniref:RNA polymerase sigma factor n=1 Tax=Aquimarina muelleri TaxID=279356 RepID=UPI003F683B9D